MAYLTRSRFKIPDTRAPEPNLACVVGAILSFFIAPGLLIAFSISHVRARLS
jgi:hypothetical protein